MSKKIWSDQEIKFLKNEYSKKTNMEILGILNNKTIEQLRNKVRRLRLKKDIDSLGRCYLGVSSERMINDNPMKDKQTIEKMRESKIKFYKNLKSNGEKQKHKKHIFEPKINLEDKREYIKGMYQSGNTLEYIGNLLDVSANTIKRRMVKWEIPRREQKILNYRFTSNDGHIVKSSMELIADNWLFNNGIIHVYEKNLGETKFKCDFYIPENNLYIEIFGLTDKKYKDNMKRKLKVYQDFGLIDNLVAIFPRDNIPEKLRFLLSISKIQRGIKEYEIKI